MNELYSVEQVCEILNVSVSTVLRLIYAKKIAAVKVGSTWRVTEEELDRIKKEGTR